MDIKHLTDRISYFIKKYKYAALVLAFGLLLMAIPTTEKKKDVVSSSTPERIELKTMDEKLATILCQIKGAGNVQVLLTEAAGEEICYQSNGSENSGENTYSKNTDTVIITDENRNQSGLVRQVNPPAYLGAVVVCQGADNPTVQLAIVDAVSKLTGLGANKISVLKMK